MRKIVLAAVLVCGVTSTSWAFSLSDTIGVWSVSHVSQTSGRVITDTFTIGNFQTIDGVQYGTGVVGSAGYFALTYVNADDQLEIGFTAYGQLYIYELGILDLPGTSVVGVGEYGSAPVDTTVAATHTATAQRLSTWLSTSGVQSQQHALRSGQANEDLAALAAAFATFSGE